MKEVACFISPHGFGHATRVIAVLEALRRLQPACHAHLFTTVPEPLFADTLTDYSYHRELVDIGMVQSSALTVDIPATCRRLDDFLPYSADRLTELASRCAGCAFILCDIAPMGIAVGQLAGIPSILVENFTWDWIYAPYSRQYPELQPHIQFFGSLFRQAGHRIQTEPLCNVTPRDMACGPIFRRTRATGDHIPERLNIRGKKLILLTMGGISQDLPDLSSLEQQSDLFFVIPGRQDTVQIGRNILLLNSNSDLYHPDLIAAADLVVCKAGYSTIAECYQAGTRVVAIGRDDFPESQTLQRYVEKVMGGISISPEVYGNGSWLPLVREHLSQPRPSPAKENGADKVAAFLSGLL